MKIILLTGLVTALFYFKGDYFLKLLKVDVERFKKYAVFFDRKLIIKISYILALDWLLYFGMWFCLCYSQLSILQIFVMAVNYAAASLIGILVFILPNGLIAREAVFIALGRYFGEDTSFLLVYSLLARFLYLMGDITIYLVTLFKDRTSR
jgi:uncharacterized membrane protein YbhN (UPF0104 family)